LGVMWKNLSADTKESYYTASRQADEEHKRKYPGYYYSPKEARINKMQKHNLALARKGSKPVDAMHLVKVSLCCYQIFPLPGLCLVDGYFCVVMRCVRSYLATCMDCS
jgi:hypothetical protein